ncbi:MAG: copper resistance protein CopC [Gemmatimonadota bacterium]
MSAHRAAARVLVVLLTVTVAGARAALAHPRLLHTRPTAGSTVAAADATELRLTFNEAPEPAPSTVRLTGPSGQVVPLGALRAASGDPNSLVTELPARLPPGQYTVAWHVAGDDGHMVAGSFAFVIGLPGGTAPASVSPLPSSPDPVHATAPVAEPGAVDASQGALENPEYITARWLMYAALMALVGVAAFRFAVLGRAQRARPLANGLEYSAARRAARLGLIAGLLLLGSLALRLVAQRASMAQANGPGPALWDVILTRTTWGHAWLVQLGGAIGVALLCVGLARSNRDGESPRLAWVAFAVLVIGLSLTPAFSGHAIASGRLTVLAVAADGVHVLAAGAWVGTLLAMLVAGLPSAYELESGIRADAMARIVAAFSPIALASAATLLVTGLFAAWLHIGSFAALWQSGYGRTLLIKLAVLAGVVATGAFNWKWVQPGLAHAGPRGERAAASLRISGRVELAVGALVVLVTAILVALPTPHDLP